MSERRLRIAMLSTHSCPAGPLGARDTGGMSVYVREVACELGKQGHLIDVYTRAHDAVEGENADLGQNVRLIHLKAGRKNFHTIAIYPYVSEFAHNLENFREENNLSYDLIFSHYWLSGCAGEYLKRWWHVPHIIMFHTLGAIKNAIGEKESDLRLREESRLIKNCDRIIAPTDREKENLVSYYGAQEEKISVIPCGVNLELFQPLPRAWAKEQLSLNGNRMVLFVGRIEPLKGIDRLLGAFALMANKEVARLVIVGGDVQSKPEIERLKRLSKKLGIQDLVSFTGLVKQSNLPLYYSAADVLVIPSHYESFGLVALEALACGTRVVATDVGDLKNIIQQGVTGYVVVENTPEALAEKIESVLSRTCLSGRSVAFIRASVILFGWPNVAEKVSQEFYRVLSEYLPESTRLPSTISRSCTPGTGQV